MKHNFQYHIHVYPMMSSFCFEIDQIEEPQDTYTSGGETKQAPVFHVSHDTLLDSDRGMDVVSSFVI